MKLFLLGMMGAGKSYWAKKMARKTKTAAFDLDHLVEMHEEKSIAELFAEDGEEYFRMAEAKVLRWFGEKKHFVLAVGGGTPFYHDNMRWMNTNGITVWIDESVELLFARLKTERDHRPAIASLDDEQLEAWIRERLAERSPFYAQAQYHLQGTGITDAAFAKILQTHA